MINIPFWINNHGNARLLATYEITGLCQSFVVNVLEKHDVCNFIF
jgi:hypothetical protein